MLWIIGIIVIVGIIGFVIKSLNIKGKKVTSQDLYKQVMSFRMFDTSSQAIDAEYFSNFITNRNDLVQGILKKTEEMKMSNEERMNFLYQAIKTNWFYDKLGNDNISYINKLENSQFVLNTPPLELGKNLAPLLLNYITDNERIPLAEHLFNETRASYLLGEKFVSKPSEIIDFNHFSKEFQDFFPQKVESINTERLNSENISYKDYDPLNEISSQAKIDNLEEINLIYNYIMRNISNNSLKIKVGMAIIDYLLFQR